MNSYCYLTSMLAHRQLPYFVDIAYLYHNQNPLLPHVWRSAYANVNAVLSVSLSFGLLLYIYVREIVLFVIYVIIRICILEKIGLKIQRILVCMVIRCKMFITTILGMSGRGPHAYPASGPTSYFVTCYPKSSHGKCIFLLCRTFIGRKKYHKHI